MSVETWHHCWGNGQNSRLYLSHNIVADNASFFNRFEYFSLTLHLAEEGLRRYACAAAGGDVRRISQVRGASYGCGSCKQNDVSVPVMQTLKEPALIPGSCASAEAVAHIAVQKYVMGSPLYRQEQEWNRQGVMLSRQTMSNWLLRCADDWLAPIYGELRKLLLSWDLLHADVTEVQVLHEPGKEPQTQSYMWLYRTGSDAEHPIVLYEYQPGRGKDYPKEFLEGFRGYLQTDGYAGYNSVEGAIHVGCWAHVRRKFNDALEVSGKGKKSPTAAHEAFCQVLFLI